MKKLEIRQLKNKVIGPINLEVEAGSCICISGPSGAGKTLLLRAIADLDPHEGQLLLDGKINESYSPSSWRKRVGLLLAESAWWEEKVGDHFSKDGNVWIEQLGFEQDVARWEVHRLSTGERQRLALARLLVNQPEVLLVDEPTASLDDENVQRVEGLLKKYQQEKGATILWVSHDQEQILRVANEYYSMEQGQLNREVLQ